MFKKTWFKILIAIIFLSAALYSLIGSQQTYLERKTAERTAYEENLKKMEDSPLSNNRNSPLKFYPIDEDWVIEAAFITDDNEGMAKGFSMMMTDSTFEEMDVAGRLVFKKNGKTISLYLFDEGSSFLVPFIDQTSGQDTYGGGRYMNIAKDKMKNGRVKVDFNDASNFYCAYTPDFICPIPPKENILPISITAGEKTFK